jgi:site-specific recombinase XerD
MLTELFIHPTIRHRHAGGPMAEPLARYARQLLTQGYARGTVLRFWYIWTAFCAWLLRRQIPVAQVTETVAEQYLAERLQERRWHGRPITARCLRLNFRPAFQQLCAQWITEGMLTLPPALPVAPVWFATLLEQYRTYLETHRGLRPKTVTARVRELQRFLITLPTTSWEAVRSLITPATIEQYLVERRATLTGRGIQEATSMLRGWLRYLFVIGELPHDWAPSVPTYRQWRLADLPPRLEWEAITRVLASVEQDTATGKRDYAMLLLFVTYGWRAHEAVELRLDDIHWREERVVIRRGKNRHPRVYPLMPAVRSALIAYLRDGRPASTAREVFVRAHAPHTPLTPSSAVHHITRKYFLRAGVTPTHWGPHTLRHAFAIHLLEAGCSLKTIGDVLGHRSVESTYIYTKAPYELLRVVALDVTEVWA